MCKTLLEPVEIPADVQTLITAHNAGQITRRDFIVQAAALLTGAALTGTMIVADADAALSAAITETVTPTTSATPTREPLPIKSEMVTFEANGVTAPGYLARPTAEGKYPGVVVIQEWWGLDDHIKSVVDRMAQQGFVAVSPDLYRGEVASEPDEARKLAMGLILDQALADIQGAANYLTSLESVEPKKVGVMGFCMGGRLSMMMSWKGEANIGAVVIFYGGGINPTDDDLKAVKVPVLGLYGDRDGGIPVANVRRWELKLREFGKTAEMLVYENAQHSFFNDTRAAYNEAAAADAFQRLLRWFRAYLTA
jgi:carboxymethylenebutenolidase